MRTRRRPQAQMYRISRSDQSMSYAHVMYIHTISEKVEYGALLFVQACSHSAYISAHAAKRISTVFTAELDIDGCSYLCPTLNPLPLSLPVFPSPRVFPLAPRHCKFPVETLAGMNNGASGQPGSLS